MQIHLPFCHSKSPGFSAETAPAKEEEDTQKTRTGEGRRRKEGWEEGPRRRLDWQTYPVSASSH